MKRLLLILFVLVDASTAIGQQPAPTADGAAEAPAKPAARGPTLQIALEAARAALDACKQKGFAVSASVVDSAGVLKVLLAADGASQRGVQSSTNKAVTALAFKDPTSVLGERSKSDKSLADALTENPNFNAHAGGILLKIDGEIVGAIGVGGARPSEVDESCASSGSNQIKSRLKSATPP
jgi:uncharacterized protein GlcG (DUF336 family)